MALISRHGETDLNSGEQPKFRSWLDASLNETGEGQAHAAARFLAQNYDVKRIIASPLCRAFTTASIFADLARLPIQQDRGLLPWHLGVFAGLPKEENMAALKLFVDNPEVAPPNGESLQDFEDRAHEFYSRELERAKEDGLTAFFAHTSNVTVLENLISGQRAGEPESGETVKPGGICAIWFEDGCYEVEPVFGKPEPANYGS